MFFCGSAEACYLPLCLLLFVVSGPNRHSLKATRSSAVAERPRDASCLSVVSQLQHTYSAVFLLPITAASDLLVHKILLWLGYPIVKNFRRYLYSF